MVLHHVREPAQAPLSRHVLQGAVQLEGIVGVQPVAGDQVGAVHDQVSVRDLVLVVVVVHDGHLVVAEEPHGPCPRQLAQDGKVDMVIGVWRDDEVLVGAGAPTLIRFVVAASDSCGVHLVGPFHGILHSLVVALHLTLVPRQVEEVACQSAVALLQVRLHLLAVGVSRYRLHYRHQRPSTNVVPSSCRSFPSMPRSPDFTSSRLRLAHSSCSTK